MVCLKKKYEKNEKMLKNESRRKFGEKNYRNELNWKNRKRKRSYNLKYQVFFNTIINKEIMKD